jgi:hypothetical protein
MGQQGKLLALDERAAFSAQARELGLAHLVERFP